jgi:hypothetical protein
LTLTRLNGFQFSQGVRSRGHHGPLTYKAGIISGSGSESPGPRRRRGPLSPCPSLVAALSSKNITREILSGRGLNSAEIVATEESPD